MRTCPYCAEQIQDAAILCRYCGKSVTPVVPGEARSGPPVEARIVRGIGLVLVLVLMGIALLYAYRAQSPSAQIVSYSQAVADVQGGKATKITIASDTATIEKTDRSIETVNIGTNDNGAFQKMVTDYNATQPPASRVQLSFQKDPQTFGIVGSVLLSLLPVLLIAGLFVLLLRRSRRT